MDTPNSSPNQIALRVQQRVVWLWYKLRSPRLTGGLLIGQIFVLLLAVIIPQQYTSLDVIWMASLPIWLRSWANTLQFLGLANIFQSVWFWLLVALLLLHSLVALAEYAWPSWQRIHHSSTAKAIEWQHPLAQRVEHSVRLSDDPDEFIDQRKALLTAKKFAVNSWPNDERMVNAVRWRWHWLAIIVFYSSLVLLSVALVLSYYFINSEMFTLSLLEAQSSQIFNGKFELTESDALNRSGIVTFTPSTPSTMGYSLFWRLYTPTFFEGVLIVPTAMEPVLSIQVQNSVGETEMLIPAQENLSPAPRLSLTLPQLDQPSYFLIPSAPLAFQVSPVTDGYNVQVRRGAESTPSENIIITLGEPFEIDDYQVLLSLDHNLSFVARSDWWLLLIFVISITTILASAVLLFFSPPWQIWLIPDVKGRGGQLYGVVEKFWPGTGCKEFLQQLLIEQEQDI